MFIQMHANLALTLTLTLTLTVLILKEATPSPADIVRMMQSFQEDQDVVYVASYNMIGPSGNPATNHSRVVELKLPQKDLDNSQCKYILYYLSETDLSTLSLGAPNWSIWGSRIGRCASVPPFSTQNLNPTPTGHTLKLDFISWNSIDGILKAARCLENVGYDHTHCTNNQKYFYGQGAN